MVEMTNKEILARRLYSAFGCLCHSNSQDFTQDEESRLRLLREIVHSEYHRHSPHADYDMSDKERNKIALEYK